MTMNAHDEVVDALLAALLAAPALAGGRVQEEASFDLIPESVSAAVSLTFMGSQAELVVLDGAPLSWRTGVRISCFARHDAAGQGGRASRALHAQVYARLMASPAVRALGQIDPPRLNSDTELAGSRMGLLHADYIVTHRTAADALVSAP